MDYRWRALLAFVLLWLLYQAVEGVGERWMHSLLAVVMPVSATDAHAYAVVGLSIGAHLLMLLLVLALPKSRVGSQVVDERQ